MDNILSKVFEVTPDASKPVSLIEFFENLKKLDASIEFVQIRKGELYTPATAQDDVNFFDAEAYACAYLARAYPKVLIKKIDLDTLLGAGEGALDGFIDELLAMKDSIFDNGDKVFFLTEDSIIDFANLASLSGNALKNPSAYRDDFIAHLIKSRCAEYGAKRKPKPGFTAVCFTDCGVRRAMAIRSGSYKAIPQTMLQTLYEELMESDDWGEPVCKNWYINHDISYVDIEFPDIRKEIQEKYADSLPSLPIVPGIRISTGSTGLNCLSVAMTWRLESSVNPIVFESVSQKHCDTYEGEAFIRRVHESIWAKYGEVPTCLAELSTVTLSTKKIEREIYVGKIIDKLALNKVFMQKDDGKEKRGPDYVALCKEKVVEMLPEEATGFDAAMAVLTLPENIKVPESYMPNFIKAVGKICFIK